MKQQDIDAAGYPRPSMRSSPPVAESRTTIATVFDADPPAVPMCATP
jgi:hypothetical protein